MKADIKTGKGLLQKFPDFRFFTAATAIFMMLGAKGILPSDTELLRALHSGNSQNIQKWGISGCFCLLLLYTGTAIVSCVISTVIYKTMY